MRSQDETDAAAAERLSLLVSIVDFSDDAIITMSLEGILTSWNPAAEKMYGYSREEIIGQPITIITPADRLDEMSVVLSKIRDGQRLEHYETLRLRKTGGVIPVSLTVSPIYDANGAVVGASSIARDVTAQKQAFESARSMIESSLDSLVSISPEGTIVDVNEALIKVTGAARGELIGADFSDYFTEPDKARAIYQLVFAEGMAVDYPLTIRHRNGSLTDVLYNASVYRDVEGNALGVFAAARDVTAQKQAQAEIVEERRRVEEVNADLQAVEREVRVLNDGLEDRVRELAGSEARFRGLVEGAPYAMVIVDERGQIQLVNVQAETLFGYARDELLGCGVEILVPERFRQPHAEHRLGYMAAQLAREMGPDLSLFALRKDGRELPVEISLSPLQTDQGMAVSAAIRDVTLWRQLAQQLESTNSELDAFAYSVAHDLRTPLRSIDGFSQVLLEDYGALLDAEGHEHLGRVRAAAQRMGTLIDDLLSLSRVARADMTVGRTDLTAVATKIVAELRNSEPDRRAEVEIDGGLVAEADPRLADIVLRNLLGNAWKFTSTTQRAVIRVGSASGSGWFSVADNGVGFDTAHAARLFTAFQRFHTTAAFPGSGVGLAIVKRILNRHGGDIRADAAPGKGATFTFTFGSSHDAPAAAGDRAGPRPLHIQEAP